MIFSDHLLSVLRGELFKLLGQLGVRGENRCSVGRLVHDVHNFSTGVSVLLQKRCDGFAGLWRVGDLQLTLRVLVLGVNDDESAIGGLGR